MTSSNPRLVGRQAKGFTLVELPAVSKSKARGFTLVELLVVIGIIALLISILLPSLNKARRQAYAAACASNMKQIATAMLSYFNDAHGHLMPMIIPVSSSVAPASGNASHNIWPNGFFWATELVGLHYIKAPWVTFPVNPSTTPNVAPSYVPTSGSVFWCPQCSDDSNVLQFGSGEVGAEPTDYPTSSINNTCCQLYNRNADGEGNGNVDSNFGNYGIATWYMPFARLTSNGGTYYNETVGQMDQDPPFVWYHPLDGQIDLELQNRGTSSPGIWTRTLTQVKHSAQMVLLLEGNSDEICYQDGSNLTYSYAPRMAARHGAMTNNTLAMAASPSRRNTDAYTNIAFFDGHVEMLPTAPYSENEASGQPFSVNPGSPVIFYLSNQ